MMQTRERYLRTPQNRSGNVLSLRANRLVQRWVLACCVWLSAAGFTQAESTTSAAPPDAGPPSAVPVTNWFLQLPTTDPVPFKGVLERDKAGIGGAAVAYPINGGAIFLAALLVHGALNEAAKAGQRTELQKAADKVLAPYETVLSKYRHQDLIAAIGNPPLSAPPADARWHVQSTPVFALTPDQTALVLENDIVVRQAGANGEVRFQGPIKVVGERVKDAEPLAYWTQNDGDQLKKVTGNLLLESIDLAVASAAQDLPSAAATEQTHRYFEGSLFKTERATLLIERCSRVVLKTLRNTLLSVPAETRPALCGTSAVARSDG
jgi:hypothetical protein